MAKKILCISNGHGEDRIAAHIGQELIKLNTTCTALPLIGAGHSYRSLNVPLLRDSEQALPSGGFSRSSPKELWRDVRGGLLGMTWRQIQEVRAWAQRYPNGLVVAVGDIVPLLMAWLSGANYSFVATAKSEYYWRDRTGKLRSVPTPWGGSTFYSWERWLMSRPRCLANLVRDQLTADHLRQKFALNTLYLGNPMMDGLEPTGIDLGIANDEWTIVILPGSRIPEAYANFQTLVICAQVTLRALPNSVNFLTAIAPALDQSKLAEILLQKGWIRSDQSTFKLPQAQLKLVSDGFADCLHHAHLGLAMAGTATEQMVGLGKPVITIAGNGPQFTAKFAIEQARLLGCAINLIEKPAQVTAVINDILADGDYFQQLTQNALERMGTSGASARIAQTLHSLC
jgi:uncharacterized protein (TIGR03492 family)